MEAGPGKVFTDAELARLPREELVALVLSQASMIEMLILDAEWLAELLEHGLLRGSFVPPLAIRELRDLTRYRKLAVVWTRRLIGGGPT